MKKLLLVVLALASLLVAACGDREAYRTHRAERSKPKVAVGENSLIIRRAPYPNIMVLPDGSMKIDEIGIPIKEQQQRMLQESFVKLQILRQNTLAAPDADPTRHSLPITVPPGVQPFPDDLVQQIPEFKDYTEALDNYRAER